MDGRRFDFMYGRRLDRWLFIYIYIFYFQSRRTAMEISCGDTNHVCLLTVLYVEHSWTISSSGGVRNHDIYAQ